MNHDENNPDLNTPIEPGLEARLVAAVLGESSAFEAAELERLVAAKPELEIFKRRIAAVHGLVGTAMRPEQAPLRLSPERRTKVLAAIGTTTERVSNAALNMPVLLQLADARRKRRKKWIWASSLAASFMFATIISVRFIDPPSRKPARPEPSQTVLGPNFSVSLPRSEDSQDEKDKETIVLSPFEVSRTPTLRERMKKAVESPASPPMLKSAQPNPAVIGGAAGGAGGASRAISATRPAEARLLESSRQKRESEEDQARRKESTAGFVRRIDEVGSRDIVVMAPFEVNSSKDVGYAAGNSLSGGRIDTPLGITPGSISVMTKEFMDDFSVADNGPTRGSWTIGADLGNKKQESLSFYRGTPSTEGKDSYGTSSFADGFLTDLSAGNREAAAANPTFSYISPALVDQRLSQQKAAEAPATKSLLPVSRGETSAAKEAVSTFSLHVSDVSFRLAQTALARGETPPAGQIRPEEFYNAFDYGDPSPSTTDKISARIEQAAHPLVQQRNLVRIAMKVASSGRGAGQPLHLTILLDTSGSMEREDRLASVQRALGVLASLLGKNDRVTLIGFARQPRLLAENLPGDQAGKLIELASRTPFTGGTNLEEALKLAGAQARRHFNPAAQNRIVLITDGAANLGNADPAQLAAAVETLRQQKIALDACGVGTDGLDDSILEALTRKGDGRYYVLNQAEDADAGFARKLAGAFRPAAENVKVQVRFNPARVGSYRLIGFEQHRLREEDFRNDKVDAAELAANEAAVALYQVEVLPQGEGELGDVFVRFRDAATGAMVERSWTILHEPKARAFDRAAPSVQLAGVAALVAEKLAGGEAANLISLGDLAPTVNALRGHYAANGRVQELIAMFEQMRRRDGR